MRDFVRMEQDPESAGVVLKDRTGTWWQIRMDWSGPYPSIFMIQPDTSKVDDER